MFHGLLKKTRACTQVALCRLASSGSQPGDARAGGYATKGQK
jgi:hypothetical protein